MSEQQAGRCRHAAEGLGSSGEVVLPDVRIRPDEIMGVRINKALVNIVGVQSVAGMGHGRTGKLGEVVRGS